MLGTKLEKTKINFYCICHDVPFQILQEKKINQNIAVIPQSFQSGEVFCINTLNRDCNVVLRSQRLRIHYYNIVLALI